MGLPPFCAEQNIHAVGLHRLRRRSQTEDGRGDGNPTFLHAELFALWESKRGEPVAIVRRAAGGFPVRPIIATRGEYHGPSRNAVWKGALKDGTGVIDTQSGALAGVPYSFKARFEDESGKSGTNPEELLAAAHAGCFAMQLSHFLAENGTPATKLDAKAVVTLVPGTGITDSAITLVGTVPGIDAAKFKELADKAKAECPVSKALGAIKVSLDASLG